MSVGAFQDSLYKIQIAIDGLLSNFPHKWIGCLLRRMIFPYGSAYHPPQDQLHRNIVQPMLTPSVFRDRLTQHTYLSKNSQDIGYRLNQALLDVDAIDLIWKKKRTTGILTTEETEKLNQFEALRQEIIKVNEFSFDLKEILND